MAETSGLKPADVPDFVKDAEEAMARGETLDSRAVEEITIKFGKGLVGNPFTSKSGKELVEVKIPNVDENDRTPWASFVISPKMIHDNKFGKGVWMKLVSDETIRIGKPVLEGQTPEGKNIWKRDYREIPVTELKAMLEAYKNKDRSSVLGNLEEKKETAVKQPKAKNKAKEAEKSKTAEAYL